MISPDGATFFAGVPNTITITGGVRPYTLTSSEPSLMPVPQTLDSGSFQVVPANPGVIDAGLPPGSLPVRTVNISLRDARGQTAAASLKVGQNFLTGYGVSFRSNCPAASAAATAPSACAGGQTVVTLTSVTNGNLFGNRGVRFRVVRGPFTFVDPITGQSGDPVTVNTDHSGNATVILQVNANVPPQLAVLRVEDVATGVFVDEVFPISSSGPTATLTAIPNAFSFTGPLNTICGTGSADFMVFGGQPPYTSFTSDPSDLRVTPSSTSANPAVFTLTAFNPNVCLDNATIIIQDATGGRTTVTVTTKTGSASPPAPPPLAVAPASLALACGTSGSVSAVGGITSNYIVNSTHPRVTAIASGNTITISRLAADPVGSSFPTTAGISVSDGATVQTVTVTVPAFCP
ncbi:MAG TPA: hypothetical protein VFP44_11230 [Usitatibacter sp.]|nr:hypothetical protein [Usitatibacter sp.]